MPSKYINGLAISAVVVYKLLFENLLTHRKRRWFSGWWDTWNGCSSYCLEWSQGRRRGEWESDPKLGALRGAEERRRPFVSLLSICSGKRRLRQNLLDRTSEGVNGVLIRYLGNVYGFFSELSPKPEGERADMGVRDTKGGCTNLLVLMSHTILFYQKYSCVERILKRVELLTLEHPLQPPFYRASKTLFKNVARIILTNQMSTFVP